jgi:serine/threonine protein kinase
MQANQTRSSQAQTAHGFPAVLSSLYDCQGIISEDARTIVYKAKHKEVDRLVAVKLFHSVDVPRIPSGFDLSLKNTGSLNHPNIVRVYSFGISTTCHPYVVSQHFEGKTLAEFITGDGRMNVHRFCQIFLPIVHAMAYAHQKGLVHGDLTSKNVIITGSPSAGVPRITGFSIAQWHEHVMSGSNTNEKRLLYGTPAYMSPERCEGEKSNTSSDIYALGVMMYEALTGKLPFTGTTGDIIQKHLHENAPALDPSIPRPVHALVMQALAKEPHIRHQSTGDMYDALRAIGEEVGASLGMATEEPEPEPQDAAAVNKIGLAVIAIFLGVIIGVLLWSNYNAASKLPKVEDMSVSKADDHPPPVVRAAAAPDLPLTIDPQALPGSLLDQAEEALVARRFGNAEAFQLAVLRNTSATPDDKARAYFLSSRIYGERGDLKKAISEAVYADRLASHVDSKVTRSLILVHLADLYCQRREYAQAVTALSQARGIEHDTRGDDTMQMALINLLQGEAELGLNRLLDAGEHLREALYVVTKSPGRDGDARTRIDWDLANVYWKQGDYVSAKPFLEHYLANAKADQPTSNIMKAKKMLAVYAELTSDQNNSK